MLLGSEMEQHTVHWGVQSEWRKALFVPANEEQSEAARQLTERMRRRFREMKNKFPRVDAPSYQMYRGSSNRRVSAAKVA